MADLKLTEFLNSVQYSPVAMSIDLTPEQKRSIYRVTGKNPEKLELTVDELKMILQPNTSDANSPSFVALRRLHHRLLKVLAIRLRHLLLAALLFF